MCQHAIGPLQHRDLGAGAGGDMRELGSDITAAHHDDARGQRPQLKELIARDQVLGTGQGERHRPRARGDHHVPGLKILAGNVDRRRAGETRGAVQIIDAALGQAVFLLGRHRIGEATLEGDEIGPAYLKIAGHAPAAHGPGHVDRLGAADQHLFRITAAQRAGAAEWQMIDDGDRPSGGAHTRAGDLRGRTAADDNQIVALARVHEPARALVERR